MKKILTVVLIVIIAVVAAGYVAVTFSKTPENSLRILERML